MYLLWLVLVAILMLCGCFPKKHALVPQPANATIFWLWEWVWGFVTPLPSQKLTLPNCEGTQDLEERRHREERFHDHMIMMLFLLLIPCYHQLCWMNIQASLFWQALRMKILVRYIVRSLQCCVQSSQLPFHFRRCLLYHQWVTNTKEWNKFQHFVRYYCHFILHVCIEMHKCMQNKYISPYMYGINLMTLKTWNMFFHLKLQFLSWLSR